MTCGCELKGGNVGGRGYAGWRGLKGEKWDNCNSIINKIYFKNAQIKTINYYTHIIILPTTLRQVLLLLDLTLYLWVDLFVLYLVPKVYFFLEYACYLFYDLKYLIMPWYRTY